MNVHSLERSFLASRGLVCLELGERIRVESDDLHATLVDSNLVRHQQSHESVCLNQRNGRGAPFEGCFA